MLDALGSQRFEVHLDAGFGSGSRALYGGSFPVEVGAEFAVEPGEHVQVEGSGGSGRVVVGGQQRRFGLVLLAPGARSVPSSSVSPGRSCARRLRRTSREPSGVKLPMLEPM